MALFCVSSLLAFSATSCGVLEMRDATSEILSREETAVPTLKQAERYSVVESDEESVQETEAIVETDKTVTVSFTAAGGVSIDQAICVDAASRAGENKDYSFLTMYANIFPIVQNADMALVTLDAPVTDTKTELPLDAYAALTNLGFDVVNVAGVDRMAGGAAELRNAIQYASDVGAMEIGAYQDDMDAGDVRVLENDGVRVAFVAFTEEANPDTDGLVLHDLTDDASVAAIVTYADLVSDVVVVSVTWDDRTDSSIREAQRNACQTLAEAGADVIVGNDGRGLQSAEWLTAEDGTQTFVAYSLGDLMSTGTTTETIMGGLLTLDITLEESGIAALDNVQIVPIVKHYATDGSSYQITELSKYSDELAANHGAGSVSIAAMQSVVDATIPSELLPKNNG